MGITFMDWKFNINIWWNSYHNEEEKIMLETVSTILITIISLIYVFYPLIQLNSEIKKVDWED
jgi:hypothetical protein